MPKKKEKKLARHIVRVGFQKGELTLNPYHVQAQRGETIAWVLNKGRVAPFAVVMPTFAPPLGWCCRSKKGNVIKAKVRENAVPGIYPYAVCLCDGDKLLVVDPDIIVPPPKGGR